MTRRGRILIMDDLKRWRDELSGALADTDYRIETAATRAEAVGFYESALFHILILDIRMEEYDVANEEGMELLLQFEEAERSNALRIIMCSGYGDQDDRFRRAFRYGVEDFVDKGEFSDAQLLEFVDRSFHEKLKINLGLKIHWQQGLKPEAAVRNLLVGGERIKKDTPRCELMAIELDDLLCRLFHEAESLLIEPLTPGNSGTGVVLAQPIYQAGGGRPVVVKFGDFRQIDLEYQNFRRYVLPFVGGGRSTTVLDLRRTPRLGGVVYSFMGTAEGSLGDFAAFYEANDLSTVVPILDELFRNTCAAWYANLGQLCLLDLTKHYSEMMNLHPERLEVCRRDLKFVHGTDKLHFKSLSEKMELPNPIPALTGQSWTLSTYECITHGDFNPHNVLVDNEGHTWLIDFQQTGPGHLLRDIIQLDCAIRLELLTPEQATLDERLALEEALLELSGFPDPGAAPPPSDRLANPAVRKAFGACHHLRAIAGSLLSNNPGATLKEFHVGSAYLALNSLRFYSLPTLSREHAILSASLLVRHLGK